jgi:transcriptional regulator with XRE-family HTH domain
MFIGKNLKYFRQRKGIAQHQLSEITGFSKSFLSNLESDRAEPSLTSAERLAEALDITTQQLLWGDINHPEKKNDLASTIALLTENNQKLVETISLLVAELTRGKNEKK